MESSTNLESRVNARDGFKALGLTQPEILWPEAIPDPELRLIMTRENYLRTGGIAGKARDTATVLPSDALWLKWFRDRVVGSRARVGLIPGGVVVGFSDTFELSTERVTITL